MKKLFLGIAILSIALLTACTGGFQTNTGLFGSDEEILSFQALTAVSILSSQSTDTTLSQQGSSTLSSYQSLEVDPVTNTDPLTDSIDPYIELVEKFLGSNNGLSVVVTDSNLEDYEFMMTFETKTLQGETQYYTIHYNMTLTEEDDDDDEKEYAIDGIMIVNDVTYVLTGKREVEEDEDKIQFIAKLDDNNYVESKYQVEDDEVKFETKTVLNGVVVSETIIKIEDEDNEFKVELEFLSGDSKGTYEFKYEDEDGESILKIQFDVEIDGVQSKGQIKVLVVVDPVTGETSYKLYVEPEDDDAYEVDKDRDIDDEDDNEDSDDNDDSEPTE
ncbi:MAG: hypothetical protein CVV57_09450 [Tenericutes bacterium HGW-Tenericutes-2]|jgi:hypothetical protein|nr:MAG: hypothetical protein CVV57_09450 [Tenericutes bacterium HGW-Tenericutes-2]